MTTTTKVDGRKLADYSSWDIASYFKCGFSGDMNPIDHGGFFYDPRDWFAYSYASVVEFWIDDETGETVIQCGSIHNNQQDKTYVPNDGREGLSEDDILTADFQIEDTRHYNGIENDDYSQALRFPEDTAENTIWRAVRDWLTALGA